MSTFCTKCGAPVDDQARFCSVCGSAHTPREAPIAAAAPTAAPIDLSAYAARLKRVDWRGPGNVAGALLLTSLVLSLLFVFTAQVTIAGTHWTGTAILTEIGTTWAAIFGAGLGINGHAGAGGFSANGSATLDFVPLTLLVITFTVGLFVYRRASRQLTTLLGVLFFAVQAALMTTIPLLIMTFCVGMDTGDVAKLAGAGDNPITEAIAGSADINIGPSSTQVFFVGSALIVLILMAAALLRRDLTCPPLVETAQKALRGPLTGFGWLAVALIPAGWLYFVIVYAMLPAEAHTATSQLSGHDWMNIWSAVFAYGGNLGFVSLGLGTWGSYGGSATAAGHSASHYVDLNFLTRTYDNGSDPGFWAATVIAPLVLAFVAFMLTRTARRSGASGLRWTLISWVVSVPVAFIVLNNWTAASGSGSAAIVSGHASSGFQLPLATFTVTVYALWIGAMFLIARGGLEGVRRPAAHAAPPPPAY